MRRRRGHHSPDLRRSGSGARYAARQCPSRLRARPRRRHPLPLDCTRTAPAPCRRSRAAARANGLDFVLLTDHDTLAAARPRRGGLARTRCSCWSARRCRPTGAEPLSGVRPRAADRPPRPDARSRSSSASNEAGGFGFLAHPFSQRLGALPARRRRACRGATSTRDGYTGIELWSFVTDTRRAREQHRATCCGSSRRPQRFVDHPPRAQPRRVGPALRARGAASRSAASTRTRSASASAGRVPLRLMAYRRSFRYLRTHLLADAAAAGRARARTATPCSTRCARATPTSRWTRSRPARGFRFWAEGDGRARRWATRRAAGDWTLRARALRRAARGVRLLRDGAEVARGRRGHASLEHDADGARACYRVEAYLRRRTAASALDPLEPDLPALSGRARWA